MPMEMRILGVCFAAFVVMAWSPPDAVAQCAMCRTLLEGGDPAQIRLAEGLYYGILVMFAMPFSVVGVVGGLIFRSWRRKQRQSHQAAAARV